MKWQRREQNAGRLKPQAGKVNVRLVYGQVLHGRNDDPLDDVAARVARVVHRRVSTVLGIVLVAVLRTSPDVIEVLSIRVHELDRRAVTVDIDYRPQLENCYIH